LRRRAVYPLPISSATPLAIEDGKPDPRKSRPVSGQNFRNAATLRAADLQGAIQTPAPLNGPPRRIAPSKCGAGHLDFRSAGYDH
jgi:hypothetical protein